ncbi:hypothetical protein N9317_04700 [Pelagibacteraceae bacterium]|nr:hypothetical protein [Pelagibacteraceae bacterium]
MGKKNAKRLLVLTFTIFFGITTYFCFPFFINFNDDKKTGIENILSELIFYKVNIKGNIEYKLNPFPALQISEIYLNKENENSIIDNINVEVSPLDLISNKFSYNDIIIQGGEFIIDLNDLNRFNLIEEFSDKKVIFKEVSLKFFNNKQSFNLNQFSGTIEYKNSKVSELNGNLYLGEIPFKINYFKNKLNIKSKEINLKILIDNFLDENKLITININNSISFPGIETLFTELNFKKNNELIEIQSNQFKTNIFNGNLDISKSLNSKDPFQIKAIFNDVNFKKISYSELSEFFENGLNFFSNIFDANINIEFKELKTRNSVFKNLQMSFSFENGDTRVDKLKLFSDQHAINMQGRNIDYQKDKLFFYDFEFKTENLKDICKKICADKSLLDKIQGNEFKLKSKGLLNINKAKITVEENFTDRQFNDNELKKLNSNLNSLILYGKLENLFNLSRYFTLL